MIDTGISCSVDQEYHLWVETSARDPCDTCHLDVFQMSSPNDISILFDRLELSALIVSWSDCYPHVW